jgi:putative CocE/NonD family hydrolase
MGPWFHGSWEGRSSGENLGRIIFGSPTSKYYQDSIEFPFFQYFLKNIGKDAFPEAMVFFTGENKWHRLDAWPPLNSVPTSLYFNSKQRLSFSRPGELPANYTDSSLLFTSYVSDPFNPVPHEGPGIIETRTREYMTADQRFTRKRKDVIRFQTGPLAKPVTLAGPVIADLLVSISSTDADFVVKLIDVFPPDVSVNGKGPDTLYRKHRFMNGYAMLVRGEIMRGKYRNSFEKPEPFIPNEPTEVKFELPDVAHTFQKDHRIMVEIQSSWFPLADRNPQTFTDIYKATKKDFKKAIIRIYHSNDNPSKLVLPVIKED